MRPGQKVNGSVMEVLWLRVEPWSALMEWVACAAGVRYSESGLALARSAAAHLSAVTGVVRRTAA